MRARKPTASPPTVYRALNFLVDHGLAHKIGCLNLFVASEWRPQTERETEVFLICPQCHSVKELHDMDTSLA